MIKELLGLVLASSVLAVPQLAQLLPTDTPEQRLQGKVVKVVDGDTLDVQQGWYLYRVRLACIDTPEKAHKPYGLEAQEALSKFVGENVIVDITDKADRYGRRVGEVFANNGDIYNVNLKMVREGYAFVYHQYLDSCHRNRQAYLDAAVVAQDNKVGFYGIEGFPMPWDWRANRRNEN